MAGGYFRHLFSKLLRLPGSPREGALASAGKQAAGGPRRRGTLVRELRGGRARRASGWRVGAPEAQAVTRLRSL